MAKFLFSLKPD